MQTTIRQREIQIAMIATPAEYAQEVADRLIEAGIQAILNYAPISLNVPADVHVQYIDPVVHLQRMTYYLK
jgi:redox-sensing transcriptional repressor